MTGIKCCRFCLPGEWSIRVQWLRTAAGTVHVAVVETEPGASTEYGCDNLFDDGVGDQFGFYVRRITTKPQLQVSESRVAFMGSWRRILSDVCDVFDHRVDEFLTGSLRNEVRQYDEATLLKLLDSCPKVTRQQAAIVSFLG